MLVDIVAMQFDVSVCCWHCREDLLGVFHHHHCHRNHWTGLYGTCMLFIACLNHAYYCFYCKTLLQKGCRLRKLMRFEFSDLLSYDCVTCFYNIAVVLQTDDEEKRRMDILVVSSLSWICVPHLVTS